LVKIEFTRGNAATAAGILIAIGALQGPTRHPERQSLQPLTDKKRVRQEWGPAAPAIGSTAVRSGFYESVRFRSVPVQNDWNRQEHFGPREKAMASE